MRKNYLMGDCIEIPGDGHELTEAFAKMGVKVEWKPYTIPMYTAEQLGGPHIITKEMAEIGKFSFVLPNKE